jgi:hypothetical protein
LKITVKCQTKKEGAAIKLAMEDETTRAFVVVMGNLLQLPSKRARERVLKWVADKLDEDHEKESPKDTAIQG